MVKLHRLFNVNEEISNTLPPIDKQIQVNAHFHHGGAWAGVEDLTEQAYLYFIDNGYQHIIDKHQYELYMVLKHHREKINLTYACLTDTTEGVEKTRNFPLDRAYRIVHGLVEFISQWKTIAAKTAHWQFIIHHFNHAQHLATHFFLELTRRSATSLHFNIIVIGSTSSTNLLKKQNIQQIEFTNSKIEASIKDLNPTVISSKDLNKYEKAYSDKKSDFESYFIPLFLYHQKNNNPLELAKIAIRAVCLYNHYGFYFESASYLPYVKPFFNELVKDNQETRWNYIGNMFQGLIFTQKETEALTLITNFAEPFLTQSELRAKMHYLLSMVYVRYLPKKDIPKGKSHIIKAAEYIEKARDSIIKEDYVFLKVFINNGLAFILVKENKHIDALALCTQGYKLLTAELGEEKHTLHRSVLLYNSAQVYMMLNERHLAEERYQQAIMMDPFYSEYYNELGNIQQSQGQYKDALDNYQKAIQYSAPYPEVYFNQGLCFCFLDQFDDALASFKISLDLDPNQASLYVNRAEIYEEYDELNLALSDYNNALTIEPNMPIARVNRAVIHFNNKDYSMALADMDCVIRVESDNLEHYQNRLEIYKAMQHKECKKIDYDLKMIEELNAEAM